MKKKFLHGQSFFLEALHASHYSDSAKSPPKSESFQNSKNLHSNPQLDTVNPKDSCQKIQRYLQTAFLCVGNITFIKEKNSSKQNCFMHQRCPAGFCLQNLTEKTLKIVLTRHQPTLLAFISSPKIHLKAFGSGFKSK